MLFLLGFMFVRNLKLLCDVISDNIIFKLNKIDC